jgi:Bacterial mobilisation protein (MobC)
MSDNAPRKKSEARQRQKQIKIRCTAEEFNAAAANAAQSGLSTAAYARAAMLGNAGPRSKSRLPVDAQILRQVLAQHGRYGNNLNQIAYILNAEGSHKVLDADLRAALREWGEIRDTILSALGRTPHAPGDEGRA